MAEGSQRLLALDAALPVVRHEIHSTYPRVLNLGCGAKTSAHSDVMNLDWSLYLRIRRNPLLRALARLYLSPVRLARLNSISANSRAHNLAKGIPYPDNSIEVIFHSHFLEHLDREHVPGFLKEVLRVMRPGGVQRIVVPDFEKVCRDYLRHLDDCLNETAQPQWHEAYVSAILSQSVWKDANATRQFAPWRRYLENRLIGDARARGETHQWMYDRISLPQVLRDAGFRNIRVVSHPTSHIRGWRELGLDSNSDGSEYMLDSLYVECEK